MAPGDARVRATTGRNTAPPGGRPRGEAALTIGELARRTGTKATTIRWYEAAGILPPPARSAGGHRLYGPGHLARLDFVRHSRAALFGIRGVGRAGG